MMIKIFLTAVCFFISVKCLAFDLIVSEGLKGDVIQTEKLVSGKRALWNLTSILPSRYGNRDVGGDAWGALGAYNWL